MLNYLRLNITKWKETGQRRILEENQVCIEKRSWESEYTHEEVWNEAIITSLRTESWVVVLKVLT